MEMLACCISKSQSDNRNEVLAPLASTIKLVL